MVPPFLDISGGGYLGNDGWMYGLSCLSTDLCSSRLCCCISAIFCDSVPVVVACTTNALPDTFWLIWSWDYTVCTSRMTNDRLYHDEFGPIMDSRCCSMRLTRKMLVSRKRSTQLERHDSSPRENRVEGVPVMHLCVQDTVRSFLYF